ncbi:hypothetical protein R5R35_010396 [Gryllus longicercus]|uniref:MADF domain-containing protein n=1 Tax=Gryllus longicercus TaxID=2509291 RepID=A0AAN9Z0V6_9ORTH
MVQKHDILYNKRNTFYKDSQQKENVWRQIALSINGNVSTCQTRFKSLRERYSREKNCLETDASGAGCTKKVIWPLMQYIPG